MSRNPCTATSHHRLPHASFLAAAGPLQQLYALSGDAAILAPDGLNTRALAAACTRQQPGWYQLSRTARRTKSLTNILSEAKHQLFAVYHFMCKTVWSNWRARLGG